MKTRKTRRIIIFLLTLMLSGSSYYFNFYKHEEEVKNIQSKIAKLNERLVYQLKPEEMEFQISQKLDSLRFKIDSSWRVIPVYKNSIEVYEKIIKAINSASKKLDVNIDKIKSESQADLFKDIFSIKGEGNFQDLYALINILENSSEFTKIKIKEIKLIQSQNELGKPIDKVYFSFEAEVYYTTNSDFKLDTLIQRAELNSKKSISNFFKPVIKLEIPPNYDNLFEVEGARLIALMPDGVYLVDRKGNSATLTEGDPVYLGYLTKINYEKHSCEFLLNKGGILEKVIITLDKKESLK